MYSRLYFTNQAESKIEYEATTPQNLLKQRNLEHIPHNISSKGLQLESTNGVRVCRNIGQKWILDSGLKGLFWASEVPPEGSVVWLVEGPLDAYSLDTLGATSAAVLGNTLTRDQAYELRGFIPILLLDKDSAGFTGDRQSRKILTEFEIPYYSFELPSEFEAKDPNDAYLNCPEKFRKWLEEKEALVDPDERSYLANYFYKNPISICPTPFVDVNNLLGGGYKPGVHILVGEPKIGKTSLIAFLARYFSEVLEKTVLINTLEVPKDQMWARVASIPQGTPEWVDIEDNPGILSEEERKGLENVAKRLKIVAGWSAQRMIHEMKTNPTDILIIDYLQRLPETMNSDDDKLRASLGNTAGQISNLARDLGIVCIVVSSLPRSSYQSNEARPKGSGDIEYVCQSLTHLRAMNKHTLVWDLQYNTRGGNGLVYLNVDLATARFVSVGE